MNYGYDPTSPKWNRRRQADLAHQLGQLCGLDKYRDAYGMRPYVEVDGLYQGVRIRRITHLDEARRAELVEAADAIYDRVMA